MGRCLNTILRAQKPPVFCSRTCRLATLQSRGIDYVKQLALINVRDIRKILEWNEHHNIRFFRLSSGIFPFASHKTYGYSVEFARQDLAEVGLLARQLGHRLTCHPGQFTQLGSPHVHVVENSIRELKVHADMLDFMGMGPDSVIVIHMGGTYGNQKQAVLTRFKHTFCTMLPSHVQKRLVIENDELCYNVEDLLPISQKLDIPLVLDWHHAALYPSTYPTEHYLASIREVWERRGIAPKQHYSESRPGAISIMERRAHSDRVSLIPPCESDVDLMIEAKDKEQAVLELYKTYRIYPVDSSVYKVANSILINRDQSLNLQREIRASKGKKHRRPITELSDAIV
ncbi:hypothetical protein IWQ62_006396 [Dispira parvispora]|uniref:Uncharacterized protein n=1 Tax=Dispira parvispora TaxID=1520584 RepID=A0A9W8E048_9FUNG|nr:hypothetical protein IWQ62_006396 [Dispira parvispora]